MDEKINREGSYGGKTAGTVGGGFYLYACEMLLDNGPIKSIAIYASPFVAVWCKEIGGIIAYEGKSALFSWYRKVKLDRLRGRVDSLPNSPETAVVKKELSEKVLQLHADMLMREIEEIKNLGNSHERPPKPDSDKEDAG
ncbi:hypothetical protein [Pseudomonas viridiflava]|uniref:hypothetical protein n=1 Tax=Pseudomonas viridiflava TaxID=33069 RepID=UPI000F03B360|nr:hypothetical protein [Pseudomonas viridiflava]